MKITEEYIDYNVDSIEIKSERYIGDFAIRIYFSDGVKSLLTLDHF